MVAFFVSPHLIDLILLFTVLEAAILLPLWRRPRATGGGSPGAPSAGEHHTPSRSVEIVLMLLPGVCLMLAIRAALSGAAWPFVPAALAAALVAHLADLRERWLNKP